MNLPEKALSVRQPWAWAIMFAGKDVENRSWQAMNHGLNVRGRIALHAAQGMTRKEYEAAAEFMASIGVECPPAIDLWRGAIIGTVEIVDAVKKSNSPWFFGPRGLVLANPQSFVPAPVSGCLGFFNWQERRVSEFPAPAKWMLPNPTPKAQASLFQGTED